MCKGAALTRPSDKKVMLRRKSSWVKAFDATTVSSFASHRPALIVAGWARKLSSGHEPAGRG